jgi:isoquinoline 1-oxidoreductase subunit beta
MTTRRDFLRAGALTGSALLLGVTRRGEAVRVTKTAARFEPNVWIAIDESGRRVLAIGKQEMGQGVRTSLAMILADELDADWSRVELLQASPGPAFQTLNTGGSGSVAGGWRTLRQFGATARAMLVQAAASRWNVTPDSCRTESGSVLHPPSGRRVTYGDLVAAASQLPVPADVPPKAAGERRLIGTPQKHLGARQVVEGTARYGLDVRVPGMLFATLARPPVPGATVRRLDANAALGVPGVRSVVQTADGVAVVAERTWAAIQGRAALRIAWDEGRHAAFDSAGHWRALDAAANEPGVVTRRDGAAAADPAATLQATYRYPFAAHGPLEPMNCTAHVHDGRCEIWVPTQAPNRVQNLVAQMLAVPTANVHVTPTLIGGGFGRRLAVDYAREAVNVAREMAAPVQLIWTRDDDMQFGHFQNASVHRMQAALGRDGRLLSWNHRKVASLHNLSGPPTENDLRDPVAYFQDSSWGAYDIPYAIPAIETSYVRGDIPFLIGPWRAVYSPPSTFARECFLDEVASRAGVDPLDLRVRLLSEGSPTVQAGRLTIDRERLRRVLELVRERAGWDTPLPAGRARGVACNVYHGQTHVAYVVEVSQLATPPREGYLPFTVHRVVGVVDCGIVVNPLGVEQQMESGIIWALSNMKGEITFARGRAQQRSFRDFHVLRLSETPVIETHIVPSHGERAFGIGEPPVPPLVPAVVNALFALTGRRIRQLPIRAEDLA